MRREDGELRDRVQRAAEERWEQRHVSAALCERHGPVVMRVSRRAVEATERRATGPLDLVR